jgi:hypothetical protein
VLRSAESLLDDAECPDSRSCRVSWCKSAGVVPPKLKRLHHLLLGGLVECRVKEEGKPFGDALEREQERRDRFVTLIREELGVDD